MTHRCDEIRALVGDYAELGALPVEARTTLEAHWRECPDCVEALKGMVVQRALVGSVFVDETPPPLPEALVARCVAAMNRAARSATPGAGTRTA